MYLPPRKIFTQAKAIISANKFLFALGLFLVLGDVINFGLSTFDGNSGPGMPMVAIPNLSLGWQNTISSVIFVFFILVFVLFFRAKAAIIAAVKAIEDKQETSFLKAFRVSTLFYSRLLMLTVLIELGLGLLGLVLGGTIASFIGQKQIGQAWILGIFGGLIFLPVLIISALVNTLAPMFVVIFDLKIGEAMTRSYELITTFGLQLVGFGFILWFIEFLPFVLFTGLTYYNHSLIVNLIGLIVLFIIEILIQIFQQTVWVLAFLELIQPQKLEEEILPEPEVIL